MSTSNSDVLLERIRSILEQIAPSGGLEPALKAFDKIGKSRDIMSRLRILCADDPSARVRYQAERFLKAIRAHKQPIDFGNPPDPDRVARGLQTQDADVRVDATKALRLLDAKVAYQLLTAAILRPEPDHWVLASMVSLLGLTGGADAAPMATELLGHSSPRVAANALLALFAVDPAAGVAAARDRLDSDDPRMCASAAMASFTADPELAWSQVLQMLQSPDVWTRTSGSYLAAKLPHPDSERALLEALLKEDDPALVIRTLSWMGKCGTSACLESLELLARLGDPRYRATAQGSLERARTRVQNEEPATRAPATPYLESNFSLHDTLQGARSHGEVAALAAAARAAAAEVRASEEAAAGGEADPEMLSTASSDEEEEGSSEEIRRSTDFYLASMVDDELEGPVAEPPPSAPRSTSVAISIPAGAHQDPFERMAKNASVVAAVIVVLIVGAAGAHWWKQTPVAGTPPGPKPGRGKAGPTAPLTPVTVQDGRVDMNRQPRAGKLGRWGGKLKKVEPRRLVLATDAGLDLGFRLQESLEARELKGRQVILIGKVFQKGRKEITLLPGAAIAARPLDEAEE